MTATFDLSPFREALLARHNHICPRQILGLRMGLLAARMLGISLPQRRRLFAFVETNGCFADGVSVATGCELGHRTLRLVDHGKIAATFVDLRGDLGAGLRLYPRAGVRERAIAASPHAPNRWQAMLEGYQVLSDDELLCAQRVRLTLSLEQVLSRPGVRTICAGCGEEIINGRERWRDDQPFCAGCAGGSYFQPDVSLSAVPATPPRQTPPAYSH